MDSIPLQRTFPSGWIFNQMFHANYISTTSVVMVKKEVLSVVGGFDEGLRSIAEDYDLWLRISAMTPVVGVPVYTVQYRRHDSNLTLQTLKQIRADLVVLKKACNMIRQHMVDNRNHPELIDISNRMKRFYAEAAVGMFHMSAYNELLLLGVDAMKQGYVTSSLLIRWLLSLLPTQIVTVLRDMRRYLQSKLKKPGGLSL